MKSGYIKIVALVFLIPFLAWATTTTVSEVEKNLMCTCGSNMPLNSCECGTADKMRSEIAGYINQGMNKTQIINLYVSKYGETVLSSPTKEGFNLVGWLLPSFVVLVIGVILYLVLKRWSLPGNAPITKIPEGLQTKYSPLLAKELEKFEEGELT